MLPSFEIGPFTIYTYGLMMSLGFVLILLGARKMAPSIGISPDKALDLALFAILGGLIGSYINYVISYDWARVAANPISFFFFWEGGLVFLGGLLGGIGFALLFIWWHKMPLWEISDLAAVFIPLGYAIGRIGCFMAGCCYGIGTSLPWGCEFPGTAGPVHPTQLYSALLGFSLVAFALLFRKHRSFAGQSFLFYMFIYGIGRSLIEMLRINPTVIGGLTVAQFTGLGLVVAAVVLYPVLRRRNRLDNDDQAGNESEEIE